MDAKVATRTKRARKAPPERLPDTPDPVEIAMAATASGKPIPDVARRVLEEQAKLIKAQRTELGLKHVGDIVRALLWGLLAIAAIAIVIILGTIVYRATRADTLVVESFRVPPAMAQQGLTGEVVATHILDKVAEMQQQSQSTRAASSYANNWGDDLKIDIPNTGATADQLWKLLRRWLGQETRISGELIQGQNGLELFARVGAQPSKRFVEKDGDFDTLLASGAELIYKETQPYRYSVYLSSLGAERRTERLAVLEQLAKHPSPVERKWAYNGLSVELRSQGDFAGSAAAARRALEIDPQLIPATSNLGTAMALVGHEQAAVDTDLKSLGLPLGDGTDPDIVAANRCRINGQVGWATRDPVRIEKAASCLESSASSFGSLGTPLRMDAALVRHDFLQAVNYRAPVSSPPGPAAVYNEAGYRLFGEMVRGPSPALAAALADFTNASASMSSQSPFNRAVAPTRDLPLRAEALVLLGQPTEAAKLIAGTPMDCYQCVRTRGMVAQALGDLPQAQRWYVDAIRQAPRLAPAYVDWGRLLVRARRFDSAILKLARAAGLSPNWADPLKYWGDALAAEGKRAEAIAKYDAALKRAPKWRELQQARRKLG